jgi:alpha-N-acetylglucosamine transferase
VTAMCNGDGYLPGVEALGRSLAATGTQAARVVMISPDVSASAREKLTAEGWDVREVVPIDNPNAKTAQLFPRFHNTFTKLRAWELTEFERVVFLDADTIVLQNVDELFTRPYFAAAPDFFLPDRFNSGVMALVPSRERFAAMVEMLGKTDSYDGGDQGFLNNFFEGWWGMPVEHRLPAGYNLHHFIYQFLRAHPVLRKNLEQEAKIVHYTVQKPWLAKPTLTGGSGIWWNAYFGIHPDEDAPWKDRLHAAEDWTFERLARLVVK